jgi:hypothetical protein
MQKIVAEESGGNAAKLDGHAVDGVRMAAAAKEGGEGVAHLVPGIGRTRGCEACLSSIFFSLLHSKASFTFQNSPQILLCKKKIPHHIKMSANTWSTKCR